MQIRESLKQFDKVNATAVKVQCVLGNAGFKERVHKCPKDTLLVKSRMAIRSFAVKYKKLFSIHLTKRN